MDITLNTLNKLAIAMFYHAKANGEIITTQDRIESEDRFDWSKAPADTLVILNCPDEEMARDCLQQFRESVVQGQISEMEGF